MADSPYRRRAPKAILDGTTAPSWRGAGRELPELWRVRPARPERIVVVSPMRADLWDSTAAARRVGRVTRKQTPPASASCPETAAAAAAFLDGQQITHTQCGQCGTEIAGVNGLYSCGVCGWSNPWYDGHRELPAAEEDPDWPGREQAS